jgi:acyl-lipid omega-6 desaturase (Delta-12 desaturase)
MTANIGIDRLHHVSRRFRFYRLPQVLRAHPELNGVSKLSFVDSVRSVGLALWDESAQRLISFKHAARVSTMSERSSAGFKPQND